MKHVKIFEEFEGGLASAGPRTYVYYIENNSDDKFSATVRDQDGKTVYEVKTNDLKNDGHMKSKDDLQGLRQLLISKNKIKQGDSLEPAKLNNN